MLIKGEVLSLIFRNADNGYTVFDLRCSGEVITAVGIFPEIYEGAEVELCGDYKFHSRHGLQFLADSGSILPPTDVVNIEKFLKSGLFRGVGAITAGLIVKQFGSKSLEVIEKQPERLAEIRGISLRRAIEISESYCAQREMQDTLLYLQHFEISINLAIKIYKKYGASTQRLIQENPYRLIDDIDRVGFLTADKIALEMGIEKDSDFRIRAGILYVLKEASLKGGHTYLPQEILIKQVIQILGFKNEQLDKVNAKLEDMLFLSEIKDFALPQHRAIMMYKSYQTEKSIAKRLIRLNLSHSAPQYDFNNEIDVFEKTFNIKLHENQREAVNASLLSGVHIITGGPGTGKTTIIKCLIFVLQNLSRTYCLCAPTGRAAKRMSEATGEGAKTIHRLLDLDFKNGEGHFTYNDTTQLPADVIICDEVSMVDEYVFNSLLKAIQDGSSIILVGDKDQLASVGAGNVLSDLIECKQFNVTYLTQIYRQTEDSLIITNAHRINNGEMPLLDNQSKDFFFVEKENPFDILEAAQSMCTARLPKYLNVDSNEIQVLSPMKKGVAGVINLNKQLRDSLNKTVVIGEDLRSGEYTFRVGDKVMQNVNNYELEWKQFSNIGYECGRGVFNGDIGYITYINHQNMSFTIRFEDDKVAEYSFGDVDQIIPAYAISVHKSQGSEFEAVVITLTKGNFFIMTRNLLYTAVTRAKRMVVIIGTQEILFNMVKNNYTAKRYSLLKELILEEQKRDF